MKRYRPLIWPVAVLVIGVLAGWGAETAVARFENYALYGFMRPAADLLLIIGVAWLTAALLRVARRGGR